MDSLYENDPHPGFPENIDPALILDADFNSTECASDADPLEDLDLDVHLGWQNVEDPEDPNLHCSPLSRASTSATTATPKRRLRFKQAVEETPQTQPTKRRRLRTKQAVEQSVTQ